LPLFVPLESTSSLFITTYEDIAGVIFLHWDRFTDRLAEGGGRINLLGNRELAHPVSRRN
jgi:hypothetical protein